MSGEPKDLIDMDEFDPAILERQEQVRKQDKEIGDNDAKALLQRRKKAYVNVFKKGKTDQEDIDFVMADLGWFCRAFTPTYDKRDGPNAQELMLIKEGRREVYQRIKDYSGLDFDALLLKYTDLTTKGT